MDILILDDRQERHVQFKKSLIGHSLTHTLTIAECINALERNHFDLVCLDHDLDGKVYQPPGPDTGYAVAQWIVEHPKHKPDRIILHSLYDEARQAMADILPEAVQIPFAWLPDAVIIKNNEVLRNDMFEL